MVLIRVYLVAFILCYSVVRLLAGSTTNINMTLHTSSYMSAYTSNQTPSLSTLPTSVVLGSSPSITSRIPRLTPAPSASKDATDWSSMSSTVVRNGTDIKRRTRPKIPGGAKLSSFGIVMVVIGGILVTVMIVCLLIICCRGRERGPGRAHTPHSNVKMKPWKTPDLSTTNELTEDTIDNSNHPQSHHNSGLSSTSPKLSPTSPTSNNNSLNTTTESFRTLQTNSHGDLGDFGRKLSLGRQAYEPKASVEEDAAGHEPALEAKGESADMKIHYV